MSDKKNTYKMPTHVLVRPSYYRGNFDRTEGPYNRLSHPDGNVADDPDQIVVNEEELGAIKDADIYMRRQEGMKIDPNYMYPDPKKETPYNELFDRVENYPTRQDKLKAFANETGENIEKKGRKKLAIIRGEGVRKCPFGLSIIDACENVGDAINRMAPLDSVDNDEQKQKMEKSNKLIYGYHKEGKRCPFADKLLANYDKVECDFGDTGQGESSVGFRGSPLYPSTFHGIGYDGMYGYPLGFYADNNESRNLFFGLFSLLGFHSKDEIIKVANQFDEVGEDEKADMLDKLLSKLEDAKEYDPDTFKRLEEHIKQYREEYWDQRVDPGIMWHFIEQWFGPRQYIMER